MFKQSISILQQAAEAISQADGLFIAAGAGMGVDSGLPDFRGNQGFWREYPALAKESLTFEEMANPDWFHNDPSRAWGFYGHRYFLYQKTKPHRGFEILRKWASRLNDNAFVFTSNVDGHFQKSGFHSNRVYECHGSINHLQCALICNRNIWEAKDMRFEVDSETLKAKGELPHCPHCNCLARPNILMFGDSFWQQHRSQEQARGLNQWLETNQDKKIVSIELGAGTTIPTVRRVAENMPGKHIRINAREAGGKTNTLSLPMGALQALHAIDSLL